MNYDFAKNLEMSLVHPVHILFSSCAQSGQDIIFHILWEIIIFSTYTLGYSIINVRHHAPVLSLSIFYDFWKENSRGLDIVDVTYVVNWRNHNLHDLHQLYPDLALLHV